MPIVWEGSGSNTIPITGHRTQTSGPGKGTTKTTKAATSPSTPPRAKHLRKSHSLRGPFPRSLACVVSEVIRAPPWVKSKSVYSFHFMSWFDPQFENHALKTLSPRPTRYHFSVSNSTFAILSNSAPLGHESFSAHRELESLLKKSLRGEVHFNLGARALYAADASNYRQLPIGVIFPRDAVRC